MTNYLIMPESTPEHYFYKPYEGICMRKRSRGGLWQEHSPIFSGGRDGFGIYCAGDKTVHLICTDHDNKLIYASNTNQDWKKYVISKLNNDIFISDMHLYSVRGRLNLMYSALYNGENLLIHCILGDHAKPSTVGILETPHFYIKGGRVYYTNAAGVLGFVNISDEKPSGFNPIYENAHCASVYTVDGREKILFTRDSAVYFDDAEIARDVHLEMPILVNARDKFHIMWKSGSFVRYVSSDDGKNFSEPQRFMSTGRSMNIYTVLKGDSHADYYGYHNARELVLLGNPSIFERSLEFTAKKEAELEHVKNLLNQTQMEVVAAKKEIARLGKVISALSEQKK